MNKIRKGDQVIVLTGRDKGKRGTVTQRVDEERVVVEGVNLVKKHVKPSAGNTTGGIEERPGALHASKVGLIDPETGKPTRIRKQIQDGKKVRVGAASGKVID